MYKAKELALREFGDDGANTLERYFAQIHYTAFWCIRMLKECEGIVAVIPEGVEDVVIIKNGKFELHQVKTRDESQGAWTTSEVIPILCKQYNRRRAFNGDCCYHFVSNQLADNKVRLREGSYGPLFKLKHLLETLHSGYKLGDEERKELKLFVDMITPKIISSMLEDFGDDLADTDIETLLMETYIDTDSFILAPSNNAIEELGIALNDLFSGTTFSTVELRDIYDRILLLILRKIIKETSIETRKIKPEDVLGCIHPSDYSNNYIPDLTTIPGETILDKKVWLGGFDPTEAPVFHRQKKLAEWTAITLKTLGLYDSLLRFNVAIIDQQRMCRDIICRVQKSNLAPGPKILSLVKQKLPLIREEYFQDIKEVDEQFCEGILWQETDNCSIWWHGLKHNRID